MQKKTLFKKKFQKPKKVSSEKFKSKFMTKKIKKILKSSFLVPEK